MIQFSLISLIPGLIDALQDCADPAFDSYAETVEKPTSLKTSDRSSCKLPLSNIRLFGVKLILIASVGIYGPAFANIRQGEPTQMDMRNEGNEV